MSSVSLQEFGGWGKERSTSPQGTLLFTFQGAMGETLGTRLGGTHRY